MDIHGMLCILCTVVSSSCALKTSFKCEGTRFQDAYQHIFSLSVYINNATVAHLERNGVPENVPNQVTVSDLTGVLKKDAIQLTGVVDMDCSLVETIICQLFGYVSETEDGSYPLKTFVPSIEVDVGIKNSSIVQQTLQASPEIHLICSAVVGTSSRNISWESRIYEEEYLAVDEQLSSFHRSTLPQCQMYMNSQLTLRNTKHQDMQFRCMYGDTELGSISVGFLDHGKPPDHLPVHLFLSTMLLVYSHFVILPVICVCLQKRNLIGHLRDPDNERMRMIRGWISFCVAIALSIWWTVVLVTVHTQSDYASYLGFCLIESFFLFVYAIVRLLSNRFEKPGDRHLYNGRVALSCGAVITPSICWIMINSQQHTPFSGLEAFWWFMTGISLIAFVSVSHERELKAWEKDQ